jgi:hypothetical protein
MNFSAFTMIENQFTVVVWSVKIDENQFICDTFERKNCENRRILCNQKLNIINMTQTEVRMRNEFHEMTFTSCFIRFCVCKALLNICFWQDCQRIDKPSHCFAIIYCKLHREFKFSFKFRWNSKAINQKFSVFRIAWNSSEIFSISTLEWNSIPRWFQLAEITQKSWEWKIKDQKLIPTLK